MHKLVGVVVNNSWQWDIAFITEERGKRDGSSKYAGTWSRMRSETMAEGWEGRARCQYWCRDDQFSKPGESRENIRPIDIVLNKTDGNSANKWGCRESSLFWFSKVSIASNIPNQEHTEILNGNRAGKALVSAVAGRRGIHRAHRIYPRMKTMW